MENSTSLPLEEWDKNHYWHAFTQMAEYEPLLIERAEGCHLIDQDGNEYLDGVSSLWCNVHGHRHPTIDSAIQLQLERVGHVSSLGMSNPTTIELAYRLAQIAPGDLQHVFFSSDGSSAIEVGLKIAFQYWQQCRRPRPEKTKFLAFGDAYHGDTIGSVSVGGVARFHQAFEPLLFEVVRAPVPNPRTLPENVPLDKACQYYLDEVRKLIEEHHQQLAGIIIEPLVQCAAGMIMHPVGFLAGLAQLAEQYDVLLIADEVATGFGRTGAMFACQQEEIVPDILCLGKGLTAGYLPMAATIVSPDIYKAFLGDFAQMRTLFHGHTYGGNPLAAAAALASLDIFEKADVISKLQPKIARLGVHLSQLTKLPHVADARQTGMIAAIELVQDKATDQPFPWQERRGWRVCQELLKHGIWLRPLGDVIVIMPPLVITIEQLDDLMESIGQAIQLVTQE